MTEQELNKLTKDIVAAAVQLKDTHTNQLDISVGYACCFAHSQAEYDDLYAAVQRVGTVIKNTPTGSVFLIRPIETISGPLRVLKVRLPDTTRPERGDADFNVFDYAAFKQTHLGKPGFKLISRGAVEMVELMQAGADVRAYFSNPPAEVQFGLR